MQDLESELAVIFSATQSYMGVVESAAIISVPIAEMDVALVRTTSTGTLWWTSEGFRSGDVPRILSVVI